jgi:hypothetical protein
MVKMSLNELSLLLENQLNELGEKISKIEWQELSSKNFARELNIAVQLIEKIQKTLEAINADNVKYARMNAPETIELLDFIEKELLFLKRNLEMEEKKSEIKIKEINEFEEEKTAELQSELQHRIQDILLKTRFYLERLNIFIKKHELNVEQQKSIGENLLELLGKKEKELQELKEKYEKIKKKSILGFSTEKTINETEKEFIEFLLELKKEKSLLEKDFDLFKKEITKMNETFEDLKLKQKKLFELTSEIKSKALVLISELKKERDYAKKSLLEIETEAIKLRNTYTTELLKLEEEKIKAKREAELRFENTIKKLRKQIEDKEELIKALQEIISDLKKTKK